MSTNNTEFKQFTSKDVQTFAQHWVQLETSQKSISDACDLWEAILFPVSADVFFLFWYKVAWVLCKMIKTPNGGITK